MRLETRRQHLSSILKAGAAYFGLIFGAGFIFGTIRSLSIVPRFGTRAAELMEMPLMLLVIVFGAKWVVRKFEIPRTVRDRLKVGWLALSLVLLLEFTLVLKLRDMTLTEYFRELDPVSGTVYYLMLMVFALMPLLIMPGRGRAAKG